MGLLDLFDSRDKKKRLSHVRNLVALGMSDGHFDNDEMQMVSKIAVRAGLSLDELKRVFERPESVKFTPPDSMVERVEQLYDMVLLMMIDGEIHQREVALCRITAINLGFRTDIIDKIVYDVIDFVAKGMALSFVLDQIDRKYGNYY